MIRYADRKIFYHIHRVKSNSFLATARKRLEIVVLAIMSSQSYSEFIHELQMNLKYVRIFSLSEVACSDFCCAGP